MKYIIIVLFSLLLIGCKTSLSHNQPSIKKQFKDTVIVEVDKGIKVFPVLTIKAKVSNFTNKTIVCNTRYAYIGPIKFYKDDIEIFDNEIQPSGYPTKKYTIDLKQAEKIYQQKQSQFVSIFHVRDYYFFKSHLVFIKPNEEKEVIFTHAYFYAGHNFDRKSNYKASYELQHSGNLLEHYLMKEDSDSIKNAGVKFFDFYKVYPKESIKIKEDYYVD